MHVPLRRCIACGRVAPKADLVRIASIPGAPGERARVAIDRNATLPGRGAYLCREAPNGQPLMECGRRALANNAFNRAFRRVVDVPGEIVESVSR